jgi:HAD superfamily hydrolase (TIGR01509 family)
VTSPRERPVARGGHPGRRSAAVFDLDGTLVDNMRFHGEAWEGLARRLGSTARRERFEHEWAGKKSEEILSLLLGRPVTGEELARLSEEKESAYRAAYGPRVAPVPGLHAFLQRLRHAGYRLALATAAPAENRDLVLAGLGLAGSFEAVAGPEHAARGKPFPDLFLAAARLLGLAPEACVAFEDAANGIRAARAAGMEAVGIATGEPTADLRAAGARFAAPDFAALPAACLAWLGA